MNTKTAIAATIAAAVTMATAAPSFAADNGMQEKCYGVAKAGHNDCKTASNSCAGTVKMDREGSAFIVLPKGTCDKIAGGSTMAKM